MDAGMKVTFLLPLPSSKCVISKYIPFPLKKKIYVTFKKSFWPENHHLILCSDSFVPQFWMYTAEEPVVIGFLTGDVAKNASSLPQEQVIDTFVKQLDAVYGVANKTDPELARPASTNVKFGSVLLTFSFFLLFVFVIFISFVRIVFANTSI